jgi:hypothetical protein
MPSFLKKLKTPLFLKLPHLSCRIMHQAEWAELAAILTSSPFFITPINLMDSFIALVDEYSVEILLFSYKRMVAGNIKNLLTAF